MTLNKIKSKCPSCGNLHCDVLAIVDKMVVVKCLGKRPHQYTLNPKGKNTEWKQFFKEKAISKALK